MTLRQYRIIAAWAMIVAGVVLSAAILRHTADGSTARAQVAVIDRLTDTLDAVKRERTAAMTEARTFRRQRDSLLAPLRQPRKYAVRQHTPIVVDRTVPLPLATLLTRVAAERDTARMDTDSARTQTEETRLVAIEIDSIATERAIVDSARWTRVMTVVDTVQQELQELKQQIRPRLWRRVGRALLRSVEVGLQVIGVVTVVTEVIT